MSMLDTIRAKREELYDVARKFNVESLYVFGSCARGEETPESDIDFLVQFSPRSRFGDHVELSDAFNTLFGRKVDVVSSRGLSPYVGKLIWKDAVAV